ncbi:MAG: aminotransferase class I/II-fold pyridoxal phosphate-dependent enzyme [Candidatus Woesebacteria bacterium]|nr:aminotransferase class I/II-fold pyridoxal phosphate-dependent enzyme [Candidatus Woesebacteria bacterium]
MKENGHPTLSERALLFPDNPIRGLEELAIQTRAKGVEVIPLNIGSPDTTTPEVVLSAIKQFVDKSVNIGYGPSSGDSELIKKRSFFYKDRLNIDISPKNILITQGASEALELAIFSVANPGDEIIVIEPFFPNYKAIAEKFNVGLRGVTTRIEDGFHVIKAGESREESLKRIDEAVNSRTKAILWSSPSNPTGAVYGKSELELLYTIANKHNLFLIADEVYRLLIFNEGVKSNGVVRSPSIFDIVPQSDRARVIGIDSSSKEISFCGGRIGYLIVDESLSPTILKNASIRACPAILSQEAVKEIVNVTPDYFSGNQEELKKRRDFLHQELSNMKNLGVSVSSNPPEGAFYIIVDLGKQISAEKFCKWLLTDFTEENGSNETVLLTPMRMNTGGFYLDKNTGTSQIRIAYVRKMDELVKGIDILKLALEIYLKKEVS